MKLFLSGALFVDEIYELMKGTENFIFVANQLGSNRMEQWHVFILRRLQEHWNKLFELILACFFNKLFFVRKVFLMLIKRGIGLYFRKTFLL